jgi:alanyl-tRNA synthetase
VLDGRITAASWTPDGTKLVFCLGAYFDIWTADLDPGVSAIESLGPSRTLEEHFRDRLALCTRRIEAVSGSAAYDFVAQREAALAAVNARLNSGSQDVAQKLDAVLAHTKELEKQLKAYQQKAEAGLAEELAAKAVEKNGLKVVNAVVTVDSTEALRSLGAQVIGKLGEGIVVLGAALGEKASIVTLCSPAAIKAGHQAGKIVGALSQKLGGKGGGKPDNAMGGGKDTSKLAEVVASYP